MKDSNITTYTGAIQETYVIRLHKGDDLKQSIIKVILTKNINAGYILSSVGSLIEAQIRFANMPSSKYLKGPFEIISLTGTLGLEGSHLHIGLSDSFGKTIGGHLMDGCLVHTTVELAIGVDDRLIFKRKLDTITGYKELEIDNN